MEDHDAPEAAAAAILADRKALPPFASLRAFEAVGRIGGIRKAAAELCVDHAVVSRHLRALEAWLGVTLFDRRASTPRLNAIGQQYHEAISTSILGIARATRDVVGKTGRERLLIWCVPGMASRWLAAVLDEFCAVHPQIEIELRPTDVGPDFNGDEADGDIRFVRDIAQRTPAPGVEWLTLARPGVFPVASPEWIEANGPFARGEDLLKVRLLHEENDEEWRGWFHARGIVSPSTRLAGPRLWHAHMTLDAAQRGQGAAVTNPFLVGDDIAQGRLQRITFTSDCVQPVPIGAYVFATREDAVHRPAIEKLRHWIAARAVSFVEAAEGATVAEADRQPAAAWLGGPPPLRIVNS